MSIIFKTYTVKFQLKKEYKFIPTLNQDDQESSNLSTSCVFEPTFVPDQASLTTFHKSNRLYFCLK